MSKSEVNGREFQSYWLKFADCPYSEDEIYTYKPKHGDALIHVIEYSAYQSLQKENEELKDEIAKLREYKAMYEGLCK